MTEGERELLAAELLVERGFLAPERDDGLVDLVVQRRGYRYLTTFWERIGVLVREADGTAWRSPLESSTDLTELRLRAAVEWAAVGAPLEWARDEACAALDSFFRRFVPGTWAGAPGAADEARGSSGARAADDATPPARAKAVRA